MLLLVFVLFFGGAEGRFLQGKLALTREMLNRQWKWKYFNFIKGRERDLSVLGVLIFNVRKQLEDRSCRFQEVLLFFIINEFVTCCEMPGE